MKMTASAWVHLLIVTMLSFCLSACGGDNTVSSGSEGAVTTDPDQEPDTDDGLVDSPDVDSVRALVDSPQLPSAASVAENGVTISAIVSDENNNAVAGVEVAFSSDSGVLHVTQPVTDETGTASAILTTGGDPRNREVRVRTGAGAATSSVTVFVTGTRLLLSGPSSIGSGDTGTYNIQLLNSDGVGIPNEVVTIESAEGRVTPGMVDAVTDAEGRVAVVLTGNVGGEDRLSVIALGLSATQTVSISDFNLDIETPLVATEIPLGTAQEFKASVTQSGSPADDGQIVQFSSTRGTLSAREAATGSQPAVSGSGEAIVTLTASGAGSAGIATISAATSGGAAEQIQVEFVATDPETIDVQASPASVPLTGFSSVRAIVRDSDDNLVKNQEVDFQIVGVGSISPASGRTNSHGVVTTTYTAPGVSDGTEGVSISASLREQPAITDNATITVGGEALRIALGTGNLLEEPTTTTFEKPYVVVVTDAAGNPAPPETIFRLQIISTGFATGSFEIQDIDPDAATEDLRWVQNSTATCDSEDVNENGILNSGEDHNGSGQLEPNNVATVPNTVELDESGQGFFGISYPQNHSQWTRVRLRATATVSGTETVETVEFFLPGLAEDYTDPEVAPPGQTSPYGQPAGCSNP
ncbi:MAG: Ig-like domain-containing protein [Pseudomonadota bacterium]|nr:Ig-like domain-containing protein [Pseudomonadota bacterium]